MQQRVLKINTISELSSVYFGKHTFDFYLVYKLDPKASDCISNIKVCSGLSAAAKIERIVDVNQDESLTDLFIN